MGEPAKINSGKQVAAVKLAAFLLLVLALTDTFAEPDLWGYMCFGRLFAHSPGFPYRDAFSYTPTYDVWVFHEWLAGVLLYRIYDFFGTAGLQILKYCLGLGTAWLLYSAAKKRGAPDLWAVLPVFGIGLFYSFAFPAVRALVFTYFFFALFLYILESSSRDEKMNRLWILPPIMLLWANLHGGFPAGLGIVFLYAVGRAWSGKTWTPHLKILIICTAATLANPYFIDLWKAIFQHLSSPQAEIREWTSVPAAIMLFGPSYDLMTFIFAIGVSLPLMYFTPRGERTVYLVLGVCAVVGVIHHRNMPFFIFSFCVFAPAAMRNAYLIFKAAPKMPGTTAASLLAALFSVCLIYFNVKYLYYKTPMVLNGGCPLALDTPDRPYNPNIDALFYPVGAVNFIEKSGFSGNILPYATWGGYIAWRLHPRCKVGMDLRLETVYKRSVREKYFSFLRLEPGWEGFLDQYPHDLILVYARRENHLALSKLPQWTQVYEDHFTVIFARTGTLNKGGSNKP